MGWRRTLWWAVVVVVLLGPVVADIASGASGRDTVLVNVSVALGLLATSTLLLVLALVSRVKLLSRTLGLPASTALHRALGASVTVLVVVHMVVALPTVPQGVGLLDVLDTTNAARNAVASTVALLLITVVVLPRVGRDHYVAKVRAHALLAAIATLTAAAHIVLLFRLVRDPVMAAVFALLALATVVVVGHRWVWRPLFRPGAYLVLGLRPENPHVSTLVLTPTHLRRRIRFEPGQFVWLRLGRRPTAAEHPFTIASSAANGRRLELTIRIGGEFTREVAGLARGEAVWVDGPYGDLTAAAPPPVTTTARRPDGGPEAWTRPEDLAPADDGAAAEGLMCIAGGVGVTPVMAMLRSLSDSGDDREIRVLLAERTGEELFSAELSSLSRRLNMTVTRTGGRRIGVDMLADVLPPGARARWEYVLCGASRLTDAAVEALVECGVPEDRIRAERFG